MWVNGAINIDSLSKESAIPYSEITICHIRMKEYSKAKIAIEKAISLDSTNSVNYFYLSCLYSELREKDNALQALELAIAKGFNDKDWLNNEESLESIRQESKFKELISKIK